ncbi:hypothetical protein HOF65_02795 [bacterium]|nr:hypothetical protein [bacterium]MBT3852927.1 hypothetical protein [bacterium]MBT4633809.1 hypothetical protein [bacterium]MBT6779529.1 hypothetical protein [bacterium]
MCKFFYNSILSSIFSFTILLSLLELEVILLVLITTVELIILCNHCFFCVNAIIKYHIPIVKVFTIFTNG